MNKKFIALTSTIALLLAPATSILAEGDNSTADSENTQTEEPTTTDSESTQTEEPTTTDGESTQAEEPTTTDSENTQAEEPTTTDGESTQAEEPTTTGTKTSYTAKGTFWVDEVPLASVKNSKRFHQFKNVVAVFNATFWTTNEATVTFDNPAIFKDGHTYRVNHYDLTDKVEILEAPEVVAKDGKITVTLHGKQMSELYIEDLGVTGAASNGRKAALNTGVGY